MNDIIHSVYESPLKKYLVVPCLLFTSVLAALLVVGTHSKWTSGDGFYFLVVQNRASIQIVVQVLSGIFGALHVFTLTTLINFRTRLLLSSQKPVPLSFLSWWNGLCAKRFFDFSLPWLFCFGLLAFGAIIVAPAALWAGAITPILTTTKVPSSILVPKYTPDEQGLYWNRTDSSFEQIGSSSTNSTNFGDFSYFPVYPFGGRIMDTAASSASAHSKYDNTRFSFSGRSFGVGSSVGLTGDVQNISNASMVAYTYYEAGYRSKVSCTINTTSAFYIAPLNDTRYFYVPIDYWAIVNMPNSDLKGYSASWPGPNKLDVPFPVGIPTYALIGFVTESPLMALGAVSGNGKNMLGIASYGSILDTYPKYNFMNQTQCEVTFTPRTFQVNVNTTDLLIQVDDIGEADELLVDPTTAALGSGMGRIAQRSLIQIMLLSLINTSLYTSVVGDAFFSSVKNVYINSNSLANFPNDTASNLLGVEQAFESMIDDMLISFSGAQLMISPDGNYSTPVNATITALAIGEEKYIYAITALNFLLVLVFIAEAIRTRGWEQLRKFDYNNISSLIVASANAQKGAAIDKKLSADLRDVDVRGDEVENPSDMANFQDLHVRLEEDGNALVVTWPAKKSIDTAWDETSDTESRHESIPMGTAPSPAESSQQRLLNSLG